MIYDMKIKQCCLFSFLQTKSVSQNIIYESMVFSKQCNSFICNFSAG